MPRFSFRISGQDETRLRQIAKEKGVSLSDLGRMAMEAYIDEKLVQSNKAGPRANPSKPHSRHKGRSEVEATIQGPRLSIVERILAKGRSRPLVPLK